MFPVGGRTILATGMAAVVLVEAAMLVLLHRSIVEIVWLASVGVGIKVCLDYFGIYCSFVFLLLSSMCVWVV
jgi:hypothetical protein